VAAAIFVDLEDETDTSILAHQLSLFARPGQAILLKGELGAGKSSFARAFIRALSNPETEVPSPTFTLVQTYDATRVPVAHADLYRLKSADEAGELGLEDLCRTHIVLVEWPDKLPAPLSPDTLTLSLAGSGQKRTATLEPEGGWVQALARNDRIAEFLEAVGWDDAQRRFLEGDASSRRYETLEEGEVKSILMDMPARPDGPPVKNGLPYSRIAHLAEDIRAVVAVNDHLVSLGLSAPKTLAVNLTDGLAIIEDLGARVFGKMRLEGEDLAEPMRAAVEVLAHMASLDWPETVPVRSFGTHTVPAYDAGAMAIEVDLLPSWFWPYAYNKPIPENAKSSFETAWAKLFPHVLTGKRVWTLRDFHSPNLLWLPKRKGIARVGLIDTQDCLMGHPAYDLASLLQDARVDIPEVEQDQLFAHYCEARPGLDRADFERSYAILGAQRATKILGIFARLSKRDGKPGYLRHMPRVSRYLDRNLAHPALAELKAWYEAHLPSRVGTA
jgi:N-acetylmuramate 1-kinase